jgi:uncharacterized protein (TIGR03790 family)
MRMMLTFLRLAAVAGVLVLCSARSAHAQSVENVGVVINDNSAASQVIGDYYVKQRHIPTSQIFHINVEPQESITRAAYVAAIERPLAAAIAHGNLQDRLLYIVLTKGIPLRIEGGGGIDGTMASVDSELTLLYRRMATTAVVPTLGRVPNPYFLADKPIRDAHRFSHREFDIYLVTRLDAFTVDEAIQLIDAGLSPVTEGSVVLDTRGLPANTEGDRWLAAAADRLAMVDSPPKTVLDATVYAATATGPVLGYASWGSADRALQRRTSGVTLVKGSLAMTLAGADARTLLPPPPTWQPTTGAATPGTGVAGSPQSLLGDLLRDGATGAAGSVAEPFLQGVPRPDIVFPAYWSGFNLVEAFYLATPFLSWQTVVIGDPLCGPFVRKAMPRTDLDAGIDGPTELPTWFAGRRLAALRASMKTGQDVAPLLLRAESRLARSETAGGRAALVEAITAAPTLVGPLLQLAQLDEAAGEQEAARTRYRRVLELQPDNVIALNNLAFNLAEYGGDPASAKPLAVRAVTLSRRNPSIVDTLGWIEHLLGRDSEAAALLAEAIKGAPGGAELRLHAARVAWARGLSREAETYLREGLAREPALASRRDVVELQAALKAAAR